MKNIKPEKNLSILLGDFVHMLFSNKYSEKVKVYSIGNFSKEICGSPHTDNTCKLGHFRIVKEESVAAGVRRIKVVLENGKGE